MKIEYVVIYKNVKNSDLENDSLIKDTNEGTKIISNLHKKIGFNLRFLEILFHNEKETANLFLSDNDDHCCFCPLKSSVLSKNNTLVEKDKFYCPSLCQYTSFLSRYGLIEHLHEHAYQHADVNHYAAYFFLKDICRVMEYENAQKKINELNDLFKASLDSNVNDDYDDENSKNNSKGNVVNYFFSISTTNSLTNNTQIVGKTRHDSNSDEDSSSYSSFSIATSSCTINDAVTYDFVTNFIDETYLKSNLSEYNKIIVSFNRLLLKQNQIF